jgi:stage V sporulation protein R
MRRIVSDFDNEWNPEILQEIHDSIETIAVGEMGYDIYPNQVEMLTCEGMLEAYASHGLPFMYPHWSFGKHYLNYSKQYQAGLMGLAYEIVINSNPCVAYLMEENTLTMQALVIAHASFGHNHFFKNNYLFKQWTQPDFIIPYLAYAKRYITKCEEKYGIDRVETILDCAHTIMHYCVEKYSPEHKTKEQLEEADRKRIAWEDSQFNPLSARFIHEKEDFKKERDEFTVDPTDNLLYFIERYSPILKDWERELVRIVRNLGQYFYPQYQTSVANEGFATATHANLVYAMEERGWVDERFMLEFAVKHSGVLGQQSVSRYPGMRKIKQLSVYKLGFSIYSDIKRRCENPTKEDGFYFPDQVDRPYLDVWFDAVANYRDESFILQFLSPEVVRKMGLMTILDSDNDQSYYSVSGTSDDEQFKHVRKALSQQYDLAFGIPPIQVYDVKWKGDRKLQLRHQMTNRRPLDAEDTLRVLAHVHELWGFPVSVESMMPSGVFYESHYP